MKLNLYDVTAYTKTNKLDGGAYKAMVELSVRASSKKEAKQIAKEFLKKERWTFHKGKKWKKISIKKKDICVLSRGHEHKAGVVMHEEQSI
jgi:hypothetical protein